MERYRVKKIKAKIIGYEFYVKAFLDLPTNHVGVLLDCKPDDIKPGDIITNLDRFPQILGDNPNG